MAVTKPESQTSALNGRTHPDEEFVRILVNKLDYNELVHTTDVMLARFVDRLTDPDDSAKKHSHDLMAKLRPLEERRNFIVHSKYRPFISVEWQLGQAHTFKAGS